MHILKGATVTEEQEMMLEYIRDTLDGATVKQLREEFSSRFANHSLLMEAIKSIAIKDTKTSRWHEKKDVKPEDVITMIASYISDNTPEGVTYKQITEKFAGEIQQIGETKFNIILRRCGHKAYIRRQWRYIAIGAVRPTEKPVAVAPVATAEPEKPAKPEKPEKPVKPVKQRTPVATKIAPAPAEPADTSLRLVSQEAKVAVQRELIRRIREKYAELNDIIDVLNASIGME